MASTLLKRFAYFSGNSPSRKLLTILPVNDVISSRGGADDIVTLEEHITRNGINSLTPNIMSGFIGTLLRVQSTTWKFHDLDFHVEQGKSGLVSFIGSKEPSPYYNDDAKCSQDLGELEKKLGPISSCKDLGLKTLITCLPKATTQERRNRLEICPYLLPPKRIVYYLLPLIHLAAKRNTQFAYLLRIMPSIVSQDPQMVPIPLSWRKAVLQSTYKSELAGWVNRYDDYNHAKFILFLKDVMTHFNDDYDGVTIQKSAFLHDTDLFLKFVEEVAPGFFHHAFSLSFDRRQIGDLLSLDSIYSMEVTI